MSQNQRWVLHAVVALSGTLVGSPLGADEGPMLGAWTLTDTGNSGGQSSAAFELKNTDNEYTGTFHWNSEDKDAGTESFRETIELLRVHF